MERIHARIQESVYTKAEWEAANPVLLVGEKGFVSDDPNLFKLGDGVTPWNDLQWRGYTGTIAQVTGDNENAVMSQKVVTENLNSRDAQFNDLCTLLNWDRVIADDSPDVGDVGDLGMELVSGETYPDYV